MGDIATYGGLFFAAFVAATVLPMQSEALLAGLLISDAYSTILLLVIASVGNILGSAVNWLLGRGAERFRDRSWFPASSKALQRAEKWYRSYGRWTLLLSWMPIGGDALTVVAGILREPFWSFLALVAIAKIGRYLAVFALTTWW
ncbi:YqaA family protein [Phyllobacterium ifriqiyense]|uniref:YqaA family protein n=1 Tax=Phyllobacterium ifriqiyense TaxID=314238 RepID=UPI003398129A